MTDLGLAAIGDEQGRLIAATVDVTNFLMAHGGMPPLGKAVMRLSFPMPDGDDARVGRLAEVAGWLDEDAVHQYGTFQAYRKFGGIIALGAHFTPAYVQADRARALLHGERGAA